MGHGPGHIGSREHLQCRLQQTHHHPLVCTCRSKHYPGTECDASGTVHERISRHLCTMYPAAVPRQSCRGLDHGIQETSHLKEVRLDQHGLELCHWPASTWQEALVPTHASQSAKIESQLAQSHPCTLYRVRWANQLGASIVMLSTAAALVSTCEHLLLLHL